MNNKNAPIQIVESPPGGGKTTLAINEINNHPERLHLIIVLLRSEIKRYRESIKVKTYTPIYFAKDRTKLDNLKELLEMGVNIVSTHALFLSVDQEIIRLLKAKNYHLIIDEVLNVTNIISVPESYTDEEDDPNDSDDIPKLKPSEINWLIENKSIEILPDKSVRWLAKPTGYHRYQFVENLCNNDALIYMDGRVMMWVFPPTIFTAFANVMVLTYLFNSSLMKSYLKLFKYKYEIKGTKEILIPETEQKVYVLSSYNPKTENREQFAELMNVCKDNALNAIGTKVGKRYPLSMNWYKTNSKGQKAGLKALKNNCNNYLRHRLNASRDSVMWTSFKRFADAVSPPSFKTLDDAQRKPTFVSVSAKATNDYINRHNLLYLCDRHLNPNIARYFELYGIEVDRDGWALGELVQWIFRSAIRCGEKINLYLPSERMRSLLYKWLAYGT